MEALENYKIAHKELSKELKIPNDWYYVYYGFEFNENRWHCPDDEGECCVRYFDQENEEYDIEDLILISKTNDYFVFTGMDHSNYGDSYVVFFTNKKLTKKELFKLF